MELEDINSWPDDFYKKAQSNKELIIYYQNELDRILMKCEEDVDFRISPEPNIYLSEYKSIGTDLDEILLSHNIVAYHCTRLTDAEFNCIKEKGLKILSADLISHRLRFALKEGYFSYEEYNYLFNSPGLRSNLDRRLGKIWFSPNRSTLRESSMVYRLFRSWGGEAVYWCNEKDDCISKALRKIGIPCIIKCSLPFKEVMSFGYSYAERFLSYFIADDIKCPEPSSQFDIYMKRNVKSFEIIDIIDFFKPEFNKLTDCKNWGKYYEVHSLD